MKESDQTSTLPSTSHLAASSCRFLYTALLSVVNLLAMVCYKERVKETISISEQCHSQARADAASRNRLDRLVDDMTKRLRRRCDSTTI